jgi:excisionase family DNA binding protein
LSDLCAIVLLIKKVKNMDELFNSKALEASIKRCFAEVISERFSHLLHPTTPKEVEKQAGNKLVKIEEAAQFTGYRVKYIYNLVSQNAIPFVRMRNSLRFDLNELDLWMRSGQPQIINLGLKRLKGE